MIDYTYMKDPYETFEPGGKSIHISRPKRLIKKSSKRSSNKY